MLLIIVLTKVLLVASLMLTLSPHQVNLTTMMHEFTCRLSLSREGALQSNKFSMTEFVSRVPHACAGVGELGGHPLEEKYTHLLCGTLNGRSEVDEGAHDVTVLDGPTTLRRVCNGHYNCTPDLGKCGCGGTCGT